MYHSNSGAYMFSVTFYYFVVLWTLKARPTDLGLKLVVYCFDHIILCFEDGCTLRKTRVFECHLLWSEHKFNKLCQGICNHGDTIAWLHLQCLHNTNTNICIAFVQRRTNVFDVGPTLHKCYTNVWRLLGWQFSWLGRLTIVYMCEDVWTD